MILGAMGGVLAIALLLVGKVAFLDPLAEDFALIASPDTVSFIPLALLLLAASIGVAAAGSGLSLRRFLRV
jgi:cell division transport system permease protein